MDRKQDISHFKTDSLLPVLKEFSHLKKSYIIVDQNIANRSAEIKRHKLSVFRHLEDVEADEMMKNIPVSLQAISCLEVINLMIPRQLYLERECLAGNNYMLFIIETTNLQEDNYEEYQRTGEQVVDLADNKLTLIPRRQDLDAVEYAEEYCGLECYFIDKNGESVYYMNNGELIPIIGEVPSHVHWRYISRYLCEIVKTDEGKSLSKAKIVKIECLNELSDQCYIDNWNLDINNLRYIPSECLTNPLYLNMLRAISENEVNLEVVNRWKLYEIVVNLKIEGYCQRRYLDDNEKQSILAKHEILALKVMFDPASEVSVLSMISRVQFFNQLDLIHVKAQMLSQKSLEGNAVDV
ncbi:hypothetical protein Trydic_g14043 [Trypoxylus dichotomus]